MEETEKEVDCIFNIQFYTVIAIMDMKKCMKYTSTTYMCMSRDTETLHWLHYFMIP